jgi:rsbT co-antagonist protein RsbR
MAKTQNRTSTILSKYADDLVSEWLKAIRAGGSAKDARISESQLREQATEFISLLQQALQAGGASDAAGPEWKGTHAFLEELSKSVVTKLN